MNTALAIVVTYNRINLLKECIDALRKQTAACDILVVDNASTDGSAAWLDQIADADESPACQEQEKDIDNSPARQEHETETDETTTCTSQIIVIHLEKNMGGAGGFAAGMEKAVKLGYEFLWIMDDDTIPKEDALENLLARAKENPEFGFLASDVRWTDGSPCLMNGVRYAGSNTDRILSATFVSLLFKNQVVKKVGLPIAEYFIWGDDKEYTLRISDHYPCYFVRDSRVTHKMAVNAGSNILTDELSKVPRYFYAYRNDYATAKSRGFRDVVIYQLGFYLNFCRVLFKAKSGKKERLKVMLEGRKAGRTFICEQKIPF